MCRPHSIPRSIPSTLALTLSLVVGCTDGASQTVAVQAPGSSLLAARAPGGEWTRFTPDETGAALVEVPEGAYELATACELEGFFNFFVIRAGTGMDEVDLSCLELDTNVEITVQAPATTEVHIGLFNSSGGRIARVTPGTYDVVAIDRSLPTPRFEIRRGVVLEQATTLTFDLAATGASLREMRVTTPEELGIEESLSTNTSLRTAGGASVLLFADADRTWVFPAAALAPGDEQRVALVADGLEGMRRRRQTVTGDELELSLELPPPVVGMPRPAPEIGVAWATRFEPDTVYFGINDQDFTVFWDTLVDPTWIASGGDSSPIVIPDPTEIPGWEARWSVPSTSGFEWFLYVTQASDNDERMATVSGTLP